MTHQKCISKKNLFYSLFLLISSFSISKSYSTTNIESSYALKKLSKFKELRSLGKCLDVNGGMNIEGTNVQLWTCNETKAQKWIIDNDGIIHSSIDNNLCLDVKDGLGVKGNNVLIFKCNGTKSQEWEIGSNGEIRNSTNTSLCLDVTSGHTDNGSNVRLWTCNNTQAQQWTKRLPGRYVLKTSSHNKKYVFHKSVNRENGKVHQLDGFSLGDIHFASVFRIIEEDGRASFFLEDKKAYLGAQSNQTSMTLKSERHANELFTLERKENSSNKFFIKTKYNKYLRTSLSDDKNLRQSNNKGENAEFEIVPVRTLQAIYVRHAEGEHNANNHFSGIDPLLTDNGKIQCKATNKFAKKNQILPDIIITSPLTRTIQTTKHVFAHLIKNHTVSVIPNHLIRENRGGTGYGANQGISKDQLMKNHPWIDFSGLIENWEHVTRGYKDMEDDGYKFLQQICQSYVNKKVGVVSHAGMLTKMTHKIGPGNAELWIENVACSEAK